MTSTIDRPIPVAIREVWKDEAWDLPPWLAEIIDALSEALEIDLELAGQKCVSGGSVLISCFAMPTLGSGLV